MPILTPKVPLAHALPVLSALLYVAPAHPRFGLGGFARLVVSSTTRLTRRYSEPLRVR